MLGGKRSQLCLCCKPTHSPSGSPIRTTSSIKCGAGTVGYSTDWPGEWHSPVILKLTIAGVRRCSLTAGSWSQHPQPHRSGSTVGGGSPRYRTVSLFPYFGFALLLVSQPVAVYHLTHSITSAVGSLLPEVSQVPEWAKSQNGQSPRMGKVPEWAGSHCRLKNTHQLFLPSGASGSYAQIFSYTIFTQELWQHVRSSHITYT